MAIVVKEKHEGRESTQGADWKRTYTRVFQVLAKPAIGPKEARLAVPLEIGDLYSFGDEADTGAFVNSISARAEKQLKGGNTWIVTVSYGPFDPSVQPQNPIDWQPEVEWGWAQFQRAVFADRDGNPIRNTAGDPFNPPISEDDERPVLILTRNEANYDPELAYAYKNSVNEGSFFGADPGKVKCAGFTPRRTFSADAGGYYWVVRYEFQFNPDGWSRKLANEGYRELIDGELHPIYVGGKEAKQPIPLSETGQALGPTDDPVMLEFDTLNERDFSALGFDAFYILLLGGP